MGVREDFERLPFWGQLGIFAVIGALVLVGFYMMYYKGAQEKIDTMESQLGRLKLEITRGREAQKRYQQLQVEIERIEANINLLRRILPEELEIQRVFDEVTNRVKDAGLNLLRFTPRQVIQPPGQPYRVYPHEIVVRGSYDAMGRFFERLAGMSRLVNTESFSIIVVDARRKPPELEARLRVVTYTYVEPGT